MITISELCKIQKEVDDIIIDKLQKEHENKLANCKTELARLMYGEKYDFGLTIDDRRLAFKIELSELANEIGWFKYWKINHVKDDFRIKDEWADCLAFLLSIINSKDIAAFIERKVDLKWFTEGGHPPREYNELVNNDIKYKLEIAKAFGSLMWMGIGCGYTKEELFEAYINKSKENIRRAKEGY